MKNSSLKSRHFGEEFLYLAEIKTFANHAYTTQTAPSLSDSSIDGCWFCLSDALTFDIG